MKLSKVQIKLHPNALRLLESPRLTIVTLIMNANF